MPFSSLTIKSDPASTIGLRGGDERNTRGEESTFKQALKIGRLAQQALKPTTSKTSDSHHRALLTEVLDLSHGWLRIADDEIEGLKRELGSSAPRDTSEGKHRGIAEKGAVKLATSLAALGWKVMKRGKSYLTRLEVLRVIRAWIREWIKWGEAELEALDKDRTKHSHRNRRHRRRHRMEADDLKPHDRPPSPASPPSGRPQHAARPISQHTYANVAPLAVPLHQAPPQAGFPPQQNAQIPPIQNMPPPQMQPPHGSTNPGLQHQPMHTQPNAASFMHPSQTSSRQVPIPMGTTGQRSAASSQQQSARGQTYQKAPSHTAQMPISPLAARQPQYIPASSGHPPAYVNPQRSNGGSVRSPLPDHAWAQPGLEFGQPGYVPAAVPRQPSQRSGYRPANGMQTGYVSPDQQSLHASNAGMPYTMSPTPQYVPAADSEAPRSALAAGTAPSTAPDAMPGVLPGGNPPGMASGSFSRAPAYAHPHVPAQQASSQTSNASRVTDWVESLSNEAPDERVPIAPTPATSRSAASSRAPTARQEYAQMPFVGQVPPTAPDLYQGVPTAPQSASHCSADRRNAEAPPAHQDYAQEQGPGFAPDTTAISSAEGSSHAGGASQSRGHGARTESTRSASTVRPRMQAPIPGEASSHYSDRAASVHGPQPMPTHHNQRAPSQYSRHVPSHHSSTPTDYQTQRNVPVIPEELLEPIADPAEEQAESDVYSAQTYIPHVYKRPQACHHHPEDPDYAGCAGSDADSCQLTPSRNGVDPDHICDGCKPARQEEE
ncbi:hypothetical protein B0A48_06020 [Cryoendolithus antarcticus]|uniref:Uncharacterized protein n=1 Tax=Cryoendolithus antarcticus TaxID=1507870 RepID=A0A1V8TCL7_9PEZI|nr:hypothetical protein B0A48_06020 [Cryoendolithus antarcticus]